MTCVMTIEVAQVYAWAPGETCWMPVCKVVWPVPEPYQAGDAAGQHSPETWREANRLTEAWLRRLRGVA